jgi:thiol:disulfide interchange protein DsbD
MGFELDSRGFDSDGKMEEKGSMSQEYDEIMEGTLRYFKTQVAFSQEITITSTEVKVTGYLDYMACNGFKCVLFTQDFKLELKADE